MGSGTWSSSNFASYTTNTKHVTMDAFESSTNYNAQTLYKARNIRDSLNPMNVMRECRDSAEHPNTIPVILALDVTGSMGSSAARVAQKLNTIMTEAYANPAVGDIEFCIMGIGDLRYDDAPIQISQFESDIRIAEQLDDLYFEGGGGGNSYESYTAAWYMGTHHCSLDCWNRGRKGLIITLGDELPNPMLPKNGLNAATGDKNQVDIETSELIVEAREKFDLYHISVNDSGSSYGWNNRYGSLDKAWIDLLGEDHYKVITLDNLANTIVNIISEHINNTANTLEMQPAINENGEISW